MERPAAFFDPEQMSKLEASSSAVVQRYLDELAGDSPAEPIVRSLLDKSARRLYALCSTRLFQSIRG
jgi:RNA polymerase sigma-70 factor (ECF subfamily)